MTVFKIRDGVSCFYYKVQSQYTQQPSRRVSLKFKTILHSFNFTQKNKGDPLQYWGWKQSHPPKPKAKPAHRSSFAYQPKTTCLALYYPMQLQKYQRLSRETQPISVRLASAYADVYRRSKPIGPRRCPSARRRGSTDRKLKSAHARTPAFAIDRKKHNEL